MQIANTFCGNNKQNWVLFGASKRNYVRSKIRKLLSRRCLARFVLNDPEKPSQFAPICTDKLRYKWDISVHNVQSQPLAAQSILNFEEFISRKRTEMTKFRYTIAYFLWKLNSIWIKGQTQSFLRNIPDNTRVAIVRAKRLAAPVCIFHEIETSSDSPVSEATNILWTIRNGLIF